MANIFLSQIHDKLMGEKIYITNIKEEIEKDGAKNPQYLASYRKSERWLPFGLSNEIPWFHLFYADKMRNIIPYGLKTIKERAKDKLTLKDLFWFLTCARYLKMLDRVDINFTYSYIKSCFYNSSSAVGFVSKPISGDYAVTPISKQVAPDIHSTFYALASLKCINKFNEFFTSLQVLDTSMKIRGFILNLKSKNRFKHCASKTCNFCITEPRTSNSYFAVLSLLLLGDENQAVRQKVPAKSKDAEGLYDYCFALLLKKFLKDKNVDVDELYLYNQFQRKDGGFKIGEKTATSDVDETFWITYTLENYSWMIDYNRGGVFSYLLEKFRFFKPGEDTQNLESLIDYSRMIILYAHLMENVIAKAEDILFKNLEQYTNVNINELELRGGFKKVEQELIDFISENYNFKLSIIDHETLFGQFLSRYEESLQNIARKIMNAVATNTIIPLNDFLRNINHKKPRKERIKMETIDKLLHEMIKENFFTGIFENKFFGGRIFKRQSFNEKFITSNKPIVYADINKEKVRLREVIVEILGFIRLIEKAEERIMHEVDSLLLIDQEKEAEQQLDFNIKAVRIDAALYNRNIENFSKEFVYLNVEPQLREVRKKWKTLYDGMEAKYQNINYLMTAKIKEIKEIKLEKNHLDQLEKQIKVFSDEIDEYVRLLENALVGTASLKVNEQTSIESINEIRDILNQIGKNIEKGDKYVAEKAQAIKSPNAEIKKKRKEIIKIWEAKKTSFEDFYKCLNSGFQTFDDFLKLIEETHLKMIENVGYVNADINNKINSGMHNEALDVLETDINNISKELMNFSKTFRADVNNFMKKNRRIHYLGLYVEEIWNQREIEIMEFFPKIRDYLRKEINLNFETRLIDDFRYEVDRSILSLQNKILETQKNCREDINNLIPKTAYQEINKKYNALFGTLTETNEAIQNHEKQVKLSRQSVDESINEYKQKWDNALETFKLKINESQKNIIFNLLIKVLESIEKDRHNHYIGIDIIAKELDVDPTIIQSHLNEMIDRSKISGEILADKNRLILYSKDYYQNRKLMKELDLQIKKFNDLIESWNIQMESLGGSNLIRSPQEYKEMISNYNKMRIEIDSTFDGFVEDLGINTKNIQFKEIKEDFYNKLEEIRKVVEGMNKKMQNASDIKRKIDDELLHLTNTLNNEVSTVEKELTKRKSHTYKKNLEWFKNRESNIKTSIDKLDRQIESQLQKSHSNVPALVDMKREIKQFYTEQKIKIVRNFEEKRKFQRERITDMENERLSRIFESFITESRTAIEKCFEDTDREVKWYLDLDSNDGALKQLNMFTKDVKKLRENSNKLIEKKYKELIQVFKPFEITGKYILESWREYYSQIDRRTIEYDIKAKTEIIKRHVVVMINSSSKRYIQSAWEAKKLGIDKNFFIDRINILCAKGELTGKYDSVTDVYMEDENVKIPLDQIEMIQKGGATPVMFLNKLKTIFDRYNKVITSIGALFTITGWLLSITGQWLIVSIPLTILFGILLYVGWSIRKEKYSKMLDVEDKKESEKDKLSFS